MPAENSHPTPGRHCPTRFLWTTPVTSLDDDEAKELRDLCAQLPDSLTAINRQLKAARYRREYDPLANMAIEAVWASLDKICVSPTLHREQLLAFACNHMFGNGQARILRRLAADPNLAIRAKVKSWLNRNPVREVSLPSAKPKHARDQDVTADPNWDTDGWFYNRSARGRLSRERDVGTASRLKLPTVNDNAQLCELLNIRSQKQLGYLLTATDDGNGPYRTFEISKRSGQPRQICAPGDQLRWVQKRILRNILDRVPTSPVAHGFVKGRSTVTNAAAHVGQSIVVKFDLINFFPTIHYHRVVGLFGSLGYHVGDTRFSSDPQHRNTAAVLARLCCYTPDPRSWTHCFVPQGAPTSPAITNLICRALDARLNGLAKQYDGHYTRYADDLTFSFSDADIKVGRLRWWVDQICQQEGFAVNQDKFRAIRNSQRQSVTGIVVNDCLRVDRRLRRKMRAILHNCERNGVAAESGGEPGFLSHLQGVASYIHMIHPAEGRGLLDRIAALSAGGGRHEK